MAFSPGYKAYILLDGANGAGTNVSTYADNISFPQSTEMLEVTTFSAAGTSSKRFIPGLTGGDQIPVSGPLDSALHTQVTGMLAAQSAGTAGFTLVYGPAGSVTAMPKQTVETLVANYTVSTAVGGRQEFSATLQIDGAVANATW